MTTATTPLGPICYRCKEDFLEVVVTYSNVLKVHVIESKNLGDKMAFIGTAQMEMHCGSCRLRIPITMDIELETT